MTDQLQKIVNDLPNAPGVYFFKGADEAVIYVGKAKNLKKRVKNHFQKPDQHAFDFISRVTAVDFIRTANEKEALLLEQQFIKKLQPRWNVEWKDDKNYFFIGLSDDEFPRIFLTHQPQKKSAGQTSAVCGPFVSGRELKSFLKEIRKAFPYRSCRNLPQRSCFYESLGLCSAPCARPQKNYPRMIKTLETVLKIYRADNLRLECYDISNLSGTLAVGSMVVFQRGLPDKNSYRKFKIKTIAGQNDVASLKEVLTRRLSHPEWPNPDLIILDGGKGQLKAARGIDLPIVALAKIGKGDGKIFSPYSKKYARLSKLPPNLSNLFLQIRDEAHRFAITYNRARRKSLIK